MSTATLHLTVEQIDALFQEIGNYALFVACAHTGQYLYMSEAIQKIDGYLARRHLDGGLLFTQSITHPDDYAHCVQHFMHQMARATAPHFDKNEIITATNTCRVRHAKGHFVWIRNAYLLLDYENGQPNRLLGVYEEKTAEKGREAFLWQHLVQSISSATRLEKVRKAYEELGSDFNPKISNTETGPLLQVPFGAVAHDAITKREKEVLHLVSNGYSDKRIAEQLHISDHTAINHRKNLIHKFGVKNTAELIKAASKCYWL